MIGLYTKRSGGVWFGVACDEQRVFGTSFASSEQETLMSLLCSVPFDVPFQVFKEPSVFAESVLESVEKTYEGKEAPLPTFAMDHLPAYTRKVLQATALIPTGYVTSYSSLAKAAGGAPRAVGGVMAANPFAPLVPCHRVVKSDFSLGGYGGGLSLKLEMLKRENRGYKVPREVTVGGEKLRVFPVEFVLAKLKTGALR